MTAVDSTYIVGEEPFEVMVDWEGMLPYPPGEVIPPEIQRELREQK
jgi:hypothetical protein